MQQLESLKNTIQLKVLVMSLIIYYYVCNNLDILRREDSLLDVIFMMKINFYCSSSHNFRALAGKRRQFVLEIE